MDLATAVQTLLDAPPGSLDDPAAIEAMIQRFGLFPDGRPLYGAPYNRWKNPKAGLWQQPNQLAPFLADLRDRPIASYLEVGAFQGWTFCFITAWLWRRNPDLRAVALDPEPWFTDWDRVAPLLPIERVQATTEAVAGQAFDLVLIDGNHDYDQVRADWERVGQYAKLCAFHDIQDRDVARLPGGGVPALWN